MANTADTLGEQETLDGLVAHTLEDFEDSRIKNIRQYAFTYNNTLKSVSLPNAVTISNYAFQYCTNLETAIMPKLSYLPSSVFRYCYKLKTFDATNITSLSNQYIFRYCFSLNYLNLLNLTGVSSNALSDTGLGMIILPSVTSISTYIGSGVRTSTIDLSKKISIDSNAFREAYSLVHLILRSDTICPLSSTTAFMTTPIAEGLGWIYVPTDLVDTYKTASNWSTYANQIVSIDEYPKALDGETITDTWDEIFQAEDNDTYKTKYSVGDTKYLIVGGTYVLMQIIAFDRDILSSDHISTAKITWLAKSLSFQFPMNFEATSEGGWADCECRKFLSDTIYEQIPENVRNKIVAVDKTYTTTSSSSSTATVSDKLWIPSGWEIGASSQGDTRINYTDFFTDNSVRVKCNGLLTNSGMSWWLRSVNNSANFNYVTYSGTISGSSASGVYGFPLGFCT